MPDSNESWDIIKSTAAIWGAILSTFLAFFKVVESRKANRNKLRIKFTVFETMGVVRGKPGMEMVKIIEIIVVNISPVSKYIGIPTIELRRVLKIFNEVAQKFELAPVLGTC